MVPRMAQSKYGFRVLSRSGISTLMRLPAPIIWAIMYDALTATVEIAAADRTGTGRIRNASTSAIVYLPVLRIGSAIRKSTVR